MNRGFFMASGVGLIHPVAVLFDQAYEGVHCTFSGYVALHHFLSFVECNLIYSRTNVTLVSIRHFTGPVDDTTHYPDLHPFQVIGPGPDFCRSFLKVKQSAPT